MTVDDIARVCHEANRALCAATGDESQRPWEEAEPRQRESAVAGVRWRLENPYAPPSAQHEAWMEAKLAAGWKHGPVKDPALKEHPSLVPYRELPAPERAKDALFVAVVVALRGCWPSRTPSSSPESERARRGA